MSAFPALVHGVAVGIRRCPSAHDGMARLLIRVGALAAAIGAEQPPADLLPWFITIGAAAARFGTDVLLGPDEGSFPALVATELERARAKHPHGITTEFEAYGVILEEVDELRAEVWRQQADREAMLAELVQVAAMAQRAAEDLGLLDACPI